MAPRTKTLTPQDVKHYQTLGENLDFMWICLPIAWQSGVDFSSATLMSWDPDKESIWVQEMPSKDKLGGFDVVSVDTLSTGNPVRLDSLTDEAQAFHRARAEENIFEIDGVEYVSNFGRGPVTYYAYGRHEKDLQDAFSDWYNRTSWLVTPRESPSRSEILAELESRYGGENMETKVWKFRQNDDGLVVSALVSLRAEESLDRRVILRQSEYDYGLYSNNNGVNVCSPVFDFTTSDVWRLMSATDWDVNEIYEMMFEAGIAPADQRVGSLLNYAAVRNIGLIKQLEPELYARIVGRFNNVEFMAQFSRNGYGNIAKPKDVKWDGGNHIKAGVKDEDQDALADKYAKALDSIGVQYDKQQWVFQMKDRPERDLTPWTPLDKIRERIESGEVDFDYKVLGADSKESGLDILESLATIHTTWRDYALLLLNSTQEPLRTNWREKVIASILHWRFDTGSITEGNLAGLEILSELPDEFTKSVVDDDWQYENWRKLERLKRSRNMIVALGKYPQEPLSTEALSCIKHILDNWESCKHLISESPILSKMWVFAQEFGGRSLIPDEVLTYSLERPIDDKSGSVWIDASRDVFENGIPSDKFAKWYKSAGEPVEPASRSKIDKESAAASSELALQGIVDESGDDVSAIKLAYARGVGSQSYRNAGYKGPEVYPMGDPEVEVTLGWDGIPLLEQMANVRNVADIILKPDYQGSPSYFKLCSAFLRNDVTLKSLGFAPTLREKIAREQATAAFDSKRADAEAAKERAAALIKKAEREN